MSMTKILLIPFFIIFVLFGLAIGLALWTGRKLGRPTRSKEEVARGRVIGQYHSPHDTWHELGTETRAEGLDLFFNADDDPAAQATIMLTESKDKKMLVANNVSVPLTADFQTHISASGSYAAVVELRADPGVVGRSVNVQMLVSPDGAPIGVRIENDDEHDPAIGDWIRITRIAIVELAKR